MSFFSDLEVVLEWDFFLCLRNSTQLIVRKEVHSGQRYPGWGGRRNERGGDPSAHGVSSVMEAAIGKAPNSSMIAWRFLQPLCQERRWFGMQSFGTATLQDVHSATLKSGRYCMSPGIPSCYQAIVSTRSHVSLFYSSTCPCNVWGLSLTVSTGLWRAIISICDPVSMHALHISWGQKQSSMLKVNVPVLAVGWLQVEAKQWTLEDAQTRIDALTRQSGLVKCAWPNWEDAAGPAEINGPRGRIMY
jgi:hypothetical protein